MKTSARHNKQKNQGSAMILVVVLTVLLAVVGVMFMMTSRINDMSSAAVIDNRDLEAGVQTVVGRINTILTQDLFGTDLQKAMLDNADPDINEPYDSPGDADRWLANIEPDQSNFKWSHPSDISKHGVLPTDPMTPIVVPEYPKYTFAANTEPNMNGLIADADGDGVADAMWIRLDDICTSKGKPIFAAVRIIDNCAMLNLNTAYPYNYPDKQREAADPLPFLEQKRHINNVPSSEEGYFLTEVSYIPFLRGSDLNLNFIEGNPFGNNINSANWNNLVKARKQMNPLASGCFTPEQIYAMSVQNFKTFGPYNFLFDISDELEIRNRYLLTSRSQARFERKDVANYTLDAGGGIYATLEVPRDSINNKIEDWKIRMNPLNFNMASGGVNGYYYDRRHICTFYSFDRDISSLEGLLDTAKNRLSSKYKASTRIATIKINPAFFTPEYDYCYPQGVVGQLDGKETRKKILDILYVFRDYYQQKGLSKQDAARKAVQIVVNMIDYSDSHRLAGDGSPLFPGDGPFKDTRFGAQTKKEYPTHLNKSIVQEMMITEGGVADDFGLDAADEVYGYEQKPFISEVYSLVNNDLPVPNNLLAFAIEFANPYKDEIKLDGWKLVLSSSSVEIDLNGITVPKADGSNCGRYVIWAGSVSPVPAGDNKSIAQLLQVKSTDSIELRRKVNDDPKYIMVDRIGKSLVQALFVDPAGGGATPHVVQYNDSNWGFVFSSNHTAPDASQVPTLGSKNNATGLSNGFRLVVRDDETKQVGTLSDLEGLSLWAGYCSWDPNGLTERIDNANANNKQLHIDWQKDLDIFQYITLLDNFSYEALPGRINVNTAPKYVIAAAISSDAANPKSKTLTKPYSNDPNSVEYLAEQIVKNRPYKDIFDLSRKIPAMQRFSKTTSDEIGDLTIDNDIEERDWILSRLSNIFTVRSDTFTAYVLVRLGVDGPQRRMIAIFDRSNVWSKQDTPTLVALHPVPDPR